MGSRLRLLTAAVVLAAVGWLALGARWGWDDPRWVAVGVVVAALGWFERDPSSGRRTSGGLGTGAAGPGAGKGAGPDDGTPGGRTGPVSPP